jgi:hypothetical protein
VRDIQPSRFDENIVYATFNGIKNDDFKPYVLKSMDKGRSWTSIAANLPDETVHAIAQDFVNPDLLFIGTEFSFYFSVDGGNYWVKFQAGLPDIQIPQIAIQERENDLVIATFGRGFYILDDYSPLRHVNAETLKSEDALLFPVKDALMYIEEGGLYGTGSMYYTAPNPPFGATFTYYLKDVPETRKQQRLKKEKELFKNSEPIPQPDREVLVKEENEIEPYLVFTIRDEGGEVVRRLYEKPKKGINRLQWRLRYDNLGAQAGTKAEFNPTNNNSDGMMVLPGNYTVSLDMVYDGEKTALAGPESFTARVLQNSSLLAVDREEMVNFHQQLAELRRVSDGAQRFAGELGIRNENMRQALHYTPDAPEELANKLRAIAEQLREIDFTFNGTRPQASSEEVPPEAVSINHRMGAMLAGTWGTTSAPTQTMRTNYSIVRVTMPEILDQLKQIDESIQAAQLQLETMKAPWTPGRLPELR